MITYSFGGNCIYAKLEAELTFMIRLLLRKDTSTSVILTRNSSGDEILERDRVQNVGWGHCIPYDHERGRILSAVVDSVYINLHPECELTCSNYFRDKQRVLKLMVGHSAPSIQSTG